MKSLVRNSVLMIIIALCFSHCLTPPVFMEPQSAELLQPKEMEANIILGSSSAHPTLLPADWIPTLDAGLFLRLGLFHFLEIQTSLKNSAMLTNSYWYNSSLIESWDEQRVIGFVNWASANIYLKWKLYESARLIFLYPTKPNGKSNARFVRYPLNRDVSFIMGGGGTSLVHTTRLTHAQPSVNIQAKVLFNFYRDSLLVSIYEFQDTPPDQRLKSDYLQNKQRFFGFGYQSQWYPNARRLGYQAWTHYGYWMIGYERLLRNPAKTLPISRFQFSLGLYFDAWNGWITTTSFTWSIGLRKSPKKDGLQ